MYPADTDNIVHDYYKEYMEVMNQYERCDKGFFFIAWYISTATLYIELFILFLLIWKPSRSTIHVVFGVIIDVMIYLLVFSMFRSEFHCILLSSQEQQQYKQQNEFLKNDYTSLLSKIYTNNSAFPSFTLQFAAFLLIILYKHGHINVDFLKLNSTNNHKYLVYYQRIVLIVILLIWLPSHLWSLNSWQMLSSISLGLFIGFLWSIERIQKNKLFKNNLISHNNDDNNDDSDDNNDEEDIRI